VAAHDDVSADAMRPPPKLATQAVHADKNAVYEFGDHRLEPRRRLLTRAGETLPLAGKAFDALVYLVEHAGELVTRQALAEALWPSTIVEENNLNQAISALRRVLGDDCIVTVARRGYQFTADVRRVLVADTSAAPAGPAVAESALRPRTRLATFVALIGAVLILLAVVLWLAYRPQAVAVDNFLDAYAFSKVTEFEGVDEQAAISRDGRYVAFLREREDSWDAWVGEIGTGLFRNLTEGTLEELRNPAVRTLRFTPDGTRIVVWSRSKPDNGGIVDAGTAYPTLGGPAQAYRKGIAELDWSPDGRRIVYHTAAAGDPLFVADAEEKGDGRLIHRADPGVHNHFPVWSPAGEYIYFVRGFVSDQMNIWRIRPDGRDPRRLTFHESSVSFPTFVDERRLLYLATADDGSGPWVHALDLDDFQVQRLDTRPRLVRPSPTWYRASSISASSRKIRRYCGSCRSVRRCCSCCAASAITSACIFRATFRARSSRRCARTCSVNTFTSLRSITTGNRPARCFRGSPSISSRWPTPPPTPPARSSAIR
jgi:DNA-binding winged helix-turn-helix (wHTH) protein